MRPLLAVLVLLATPALAVDNTEHVVAAGIVTQFQAGARAAARPAQLSAKVALNPRLEASVLFGMRLGDPDVFSPGGKVAFVLLPEEHLNLYAAATASLDLRSEGGLKAFVYQVGPGIEFFFEEWPHVGFSLEFGLAGELVRGSGPASTYLSTVSTGFGGAGIHYYF